MLFVLAAIRDRAGRGHSTEIMASSSTNSRSKARPTTNGRQKPAFPSDATDSEKLDSLMHAIADLKLQQVRQHHRVMEKVDRVEQFQINTEIFEKWQVNAMKIHHTATVAHANAIARACEVPEMEDSQLEEINCPLPDAPVTVPVVDPRSIPFRLPLDSEQGILRCAKYLCEHRENKEKLARLLFQQVRAQNGDSSLKGQPMLAGKLATRCLFSSDILRLYTFEGTRPTIYDGWVSTIGQAEADKRRRGSILSLDPNKRIDSTLVGE